MDIKIGMEHFISKDDIFDLSKISMEILDKGWKRYHPYTLNIDHRNPLANRALESSNETQLKVVRDAILKTFPISEEQFITMEDHNAAILVSITDDNEEIIENAMERKSFLRSHPINNRILTDKKNRKWIDMRFVPKYSDDVMEEKNRKYLN